MDARPGRHPRHRGRLLLLEALGRAEQGDWGGAASGIAAARAAGGGLGEASVAAALVFLQAGRRGEAIGAFEEARRRDPADSRLGHALFLACYHTARALGPRGLDGVGVWERAIASWVALLNDERFWVAWRAGARNRYGVEPSGSTLAEFRRQLEAGVGAVLESGLEQTAEPRRLKALLRRELRAAEVLEAAGGFPLPGSGGTELLCGPLMIRLLRLERAFGDFLGLQATPRKRARGLMARFLDPPRERAIDPGRIPLLRICFSGLGAARAWLDLGRPREALASLDDLACPLCREPRPSRGTPAAPAVAPPAVCAATCPRFDELHPGYAGLPDKATALAADALTLAVDARLALAESAVAAGPPDLATVRECWREAVRLSSLAGREEEVRRGIVETALGRAATMARPGRFDEAVKLLDAAESVCGGPADPRLLGRLAELLAARGIETANADPSRVEEAVADLRRAVRHNPHFPHAIVNLGTALRMWAGDHVEAEAAAELLEEAVQVLQDGAERFTGRSDLGEELQKARDELAELRRWLPRKAK
jgi:tetratricopeptide (TPR) repeat protein